MYPKITATVLNRFNHITLFLRAVVLNNMFYVVHIKYIYWFNTGGTDVKTLNESTLQFANNAMQFYISVGIY